MRLAAAIFALGACISGQVLACTEPKITIDPLWLINHGSSGGVTNVWVGAEVDIFVPLVDTTCVAGLGLNGVPVPSLSVNELMVSVANPSTPGLGSLIPEFALTPDPAASGLLSSLSPGNLWFGFSGLVVPFVAPPLGPGDIYKLWFDVFVADTEVPALLTNFATFGAGTDALFPPFDPAHPITFNSPKLLADAMEHVPEPASLALALSGVVLVRIGIRRRRMA